MQELRGLFLELDPLDTGCVPYTRLQLEMEVGACTWGVLSTAGSWADCGEGGSERGACVPCFWRS